MVLTGTSGSTNFGSGTLLGIDTSPSRISYIRFTIVTPGAISTAKLRLHVTATPPPGFTAGGPHGGIVHEVDDSGWNESTITYNNRPSTGRAVANIGAVVPDTWYELDLTSLLAGRPTGTFSIAIDASSSDAVFYDSRETGANGPQLVVRLA